MRSILLNIFTSLWLIASCNSFATSSNLEKRIKTLEERLAVLDNKVNQKGNVMPRKSSCHNTCKSGPDCACSDCKCDSKEVKQCSDDSRSKACDCRPECKCNFCECGIEKSKK